MDVILLEKVRNLGDLGDQVRVRPGFARNFLLPQGKAVMATSENVAKFEARRAELERIAAESLAAAQSQRDTLQDKVVTISAKAGPEGKLFGSVSQQDIAQALGQQDIQLNKQQVRLPHGPIREVGEHEVGIHLHPDVDAQVTVKVTAAA